MSGTFDFSYGGGPVPAHRHLNGGGWVADSANVADSARVSGSAQVFGNAVVSGYAVVSGNARVFGDARVSGRAQVFGNAVVSGDARVSGDAWVYGDAVVVGNAQVTISPLILTGGEWSITVTDKHIQVGCHCRQTEDWTYATPQSAPFLESIREHVLGIARIHQARLGAELRETRTANTKSREEE